MYVLDLFQNCDVSETMFTLEQRFQIHECLQIHHIQDIQIHKAFTIHSEFGFVGIWYNVSVRTRGSNYF